MYVFKIDGISDPETMFIIQESFAELDESIQLEFDTSVNEVLVYTEEPIEEVAGVFISNGFHIEGARREL